MDGSDSLSGRGVDARLASVETLLRVVSATLTKLEAGNEKIAEKIEDMRRLEQSLVDSRAALERAFSAIAGQKSRLEEIEKDRSAKEQDLAVKIGWVRGAFWALSIVATIGSTILLGGLGYVASKFMTAEQELAATKSAVEGLKSRLDAAERGKH